jgi:hypothetical protein
MIDEALDGMLAAALGRSGVKDSVDRCEQAACLMQMLHRVP